MTTKKPLALTVADKLGAVGIDAICERVANCEFLQTIADDCGVSRGSLTRWLNNDDHAVVYARAREAQADKMAEDILRIADDGRSDTYTDAEGVERTDQDVIGRSRLRVDARKWLASKMAPKKYGEKIEQTINATVKTSREMSDDELAAVIASQSK